MRIACIGGGPAGLYFAILMRRAFPQTRITVYERNRPDDTFGWGVVFSDETLAGFGDADPESSARIRESFIHWTDIQTWYAGTCTVSTGHGFSGLSRKTLLQILHARCRELEIELQFQTEIQGIEACRDADLIVAADGVNSTVRKQLAENLRPSIDWRKCRFAWFGTDKVMTAFTFVFQETPYGLFQVHAYPFEPGRGTWIVECREEVWQRAGLDRLDEEESAAWCQDLFAEHLGGARLLTNRSLWRAFPTIRCEHWSHGNVVLLGDAVHTAHFSIGSGTKLAMEDAIALADAFRAHGTGDVPAVLAAYQQARELDVLKTQRAAQTSLEWFENSARYVGQHPLRFTFNLMTRSKRITYDNLALRDPALVQQVNERVAEAQGSPPAAAPMFLPLQLRNLRLQNRVVVSSMCMYSAVDGVPNDWHLVHLGSRAVGGAALVMAEMTNVTPAGRITPQCTGLWNEAQQQAWRRIVEFVHTHTQAKIGLQLAHAGRKGAVAHPWVGDDEPLAFGAWETLAPSPLPFRPHWPAPREMKRADLDAVRDAFVASARLALAAGFDLLELHMAHGYLLSSFLSPLTNRRTDDYGGSLENRMRYPLEVFDAVRAVWTDRPLAVRISATDWLEPDGMTPEDAVAVSLALKARGCDLIDVSTAGNVPESKPQFGRMYQVPYAEKIKYEVGIPVIAVGGIFDADHVNTIVAAGRADLCAIARAHLADPYLTAHAAARYGATEQPWPGQYAPGRPRA